MPYIIIEKDFQYNDEIYKDYAERDVGRPKLVMNDYNKAVRECKYENAKMFDGLELTLYCYSLEDIINPRMYDLHTVIIKLAKLTGQPISGDYRWDLKIPEGLGLDTLVEISKLFSNLKFYHIVEVTG